MNRKLKAILVALGVLIAPPAFADNDGVTRLTVPGNPAVPGVTLDVGAGAIDLSELSTSVQGELADLRTDTDANGATIAVQGTSIATNTADIATLQTATDGHQTAIEALQ